MGAVGTGSGDKDGKEAAPVGNDIGLETGDVGADTVGTDAVGTDTGEATGASSPIEDETRSVGAVVVLDEAAVGNETGEEEAMSVSSEGKVSVVVVLLMVVVLEVRFFDPMDFDSILFNCLI